MKNKGNYILKVLITGPESSGKSTLTKLLSSYYNCPCVEEYSREFLTDLKRPYQQSDLLSICKGQMENQRKALLINTDLIICDTGPEVIKIWGEVKYGSCGEAIEKIYLQHKYDLILLCKPDFPWIPDVMREFPDQSQRDKLYQRYQNLLLDNPAPLIELAGSIRNRKNRAILKINELLNKN